MKLVSSADIIFRHLYNLVSVDNRTFIDQWFCFKQEFDETCTSSNHVDVNENVRESPLLARIGEWAIFYFMCRACCNSTIQLFSYLTDEVSENEKISSASSVASSSSIESSVSLENTKENNISDVLKISVQSSEINTEKGDNQMTKIDSDLLDYMSQFKLFSDGFVSEWFKTFSFSTSEVREYVNWLEDKGMRLGHFLINYLGHCFHKLFGCRL